VLAVLGVNRFFLSALGAALPHVVAEDKLVMANSVAPTSGTIIGFVGAITGLGVHLVTGGGHTGSAATLLVGGAGYAAAGLIAATMPRGLLGPNLDPSEPGTASTASEIADVARGLAAGARHIWQRRQAAYALGAAGAQRLLYGILLLMAILLYRNYFYPSKGGNTALAHFTLVVITSALGYGTAALITPSATRRLTKAAWIACLLGAGGIVEGLLGATFSQIPFLILGFVLGVTAQGVSICVVTIIQESVDDAYLGRVFSLYDMVYNVTFVLGAAVSVLFMPVTGKSYPMLTVAAIGYLLAAMTYGLFTRGAQSGHDAGHPARPGTGHPAGDDPAPPAAVPPPPAGEGGGGIVPSP
jgi:hypothetical protein